MARKPGRDATPFLPSRKTLSSMRKAVSGCRGCDLYKNATQGVFGEGPVTARVVFVGEQPGDAEDKAGHPFVGHAGRILDEALEEAGIPRDTVYVTNAVKHFKWAPVGKRRLHKKPSGREVQACHPWLQAELDLLRPMFVVCLGTTATQAVFGKPMKIGENRGRFFETTAAPFTLITAHPSSVLRVPDPEARHREKAALVADLRKVARKLRELPPL